MRRCVVDASVAAKWHFPEELSENAAVLLSRQEAGELEIYAPDLILYEFGSVVLKKSRAGHVSSDDAQTILEEFVASRPRLVSAAETVALALRFAETARASFYDSTYLAAAELVGGALVTADQRFVALTAGTPFAKVVQLLSEVQP